MQIINGIEVSNQLKKDLSIVVKKINSRYNFTPTIATILVGDNPASVIYVNRKYQEASKIGINAQIIKLTSKTTEEELIEKIEILNNDKNINGILVQLPLPNHINSLKIIEKIDPKKDIDGLTSYNIGQITIGNINTTSLIPCTPHGSVTLCKTAIKDLTGKNVLVIGKSNLVGKPLAILLLQLGATVSVASKSTVNLEQYTKNADIIFVATGVPGLIKGNIIKKDAIIIDIGISKQNDKIVGDCDFESCKNIASHISPVPGGVGPMTIAYLLYNSIVCSIKQNPQIATETEFLTQKWFSI